jgi:hypothetical protein
MESQEYGPWVLNSSFTSYLFLKSLWIRICIHVHILDGPHNSNFLYHKFNSFHNTLLVSYLYPLHSLRLMSIHNFYNNFFPEHFAFWDFSFLLKQVRIKENLGLLENIELILCCSLNTPLFHWASFELQIVYSYTSSGITQTIFIWPGTTHDPPQSSIFGQESPGCSLPIG